MSPDDDESHSSCSNQSSNNCLDKFSYENKPSCGKTSENFDLSDSSVEKKRLQDLDEVLLSYFKANQYSKDDEKQQICLDTQMPLRSIDYWFAEQWKKKWENKNAKRKKYVRILNAES